MTIYIVFLAVVILVGWYLYGDKITRVQRRDCVVLSAVALLILMTMRYSIGFDYGSYNDIFEATKAGDWTTALVRPYEQGFYLLVKLVAACGGSYHILLLVCNVIMLGCVFWVVYKYSPMWWVSTSLYVTLQFMAHSMNLLRQSLAASIAFLGWGFLKKGQFWRYCLVILVAASFHISVLVMIPAYFVLRLPFNTRVLAVIGGITLVGYFAFRPLLNLVLTYFPKYSSYVGSIYDNQNSLTYVILPFLYCMLAMLVSSQLLQRGREEGDEKKYSILLYSSLITLIIYLFITKMFIVERFSIYFFMYAMLLLPEVIQLWKPQQVEATEAVETPAVAEATPDAEQPAEAMPKPAPARSPLLQYHLVTGAIVLVSCAYLAWCAFDGSHKAYPYVGIWEPGNAVSNALYYQQRAERRGFD